MTRHQGEKDHMRTTEEEIRVLVATSKLRLEKVVADAKNALFDLEKIEELLDGPKTVDLAALYVSKRYSLNYDKLKQRNDEVLGRFSTEQLKAAEREVEDFDVSHEVETKLPSGPMLNAYIKKRRRQAEQIAQDAEKASE